MGNILDKCCTNVEPGMWLNMMKSAFDCIDRSGRYSDLLSNHKEELASMIRWGKHAKQTIDNLEFQVFPIEKPIQQSPHFKKEIDDPKIEIKLIITPNEDSSSISPEGYIIFEKTYYKGQIQDRKAQGKGTLYFPHTYPTFFVTGQWANDSLTRGTIFKKAADQFGEYRQAYVCDIELLNGSRKAIVRFKDRFTYQGSIKLEGVRYFNQILTGNGRIQYENGDVYVGDIVNGLYNTSGKTADFYYARGNPCTSFKGCYRQGLREDVGVFQLDLDGTRFSLHVTFQRGTPIGQGLMRFDDGSEYRVSIEQGNSRTRSEIRPFQ